MKYLFSNTFQIFIFAMVIFAVAACGKTNCKDDISEKVFVANEESGTVSVIDASNGDVVSTIDLKHDSEMYMAHNIQGSSEWHTVWATAVPMHGHGDEYAVIINPRKNKAVKFISLGTEQHLAHVVFDNESKSAYITGNQSGQVIQVDVEKEKEVKRFDLGAESGPHGLRFMNGKLYVACMTSSELAIIDVVTGTIDHVSLGGIAVQTAVLPIINAAFVSIYDLKEVVRYDVATGDTIRIPLPAGAQGPVQIYPSPDNLKLYVCDQGILNDNPVSNKLYVISTETNAVISTVTVGNGAHGVVTSTDGSKIFVTNLADNTVSIVNASTLTVEQTVAVGEAPNGITILDCD